MGAAFVSLIGSPVTAQFCEEIAAMAAGQGDPHVISAPWLPANPHCSRALMLSGQTQVQCSWPFEYRTEAATAAFDRILVEVDACLGADAQQSADQDVNHPDFYDLRLFQRGAQEVAVSLKDKATLQQTYVTVRVTQP